MAALLLKNREAPGGLRTEFSGVVGVLGGREVPAVKGRVSANKGALVGG